MHMHKGRQTHHYATNAPAHAQTVSPFERHKHNEAAKRLRERQTIPLDVKIPAKKKQETKVYYLVPETKKEDNVPAPSVEEFERSPGIISSIRFGIAASITLIMTTIAGLLGITTTSPAQDKSGKPTISLASKMGEEPQVAKLKVPVKGNDNEASWVVMTAGTNTIAFRNGQTDVNLTKLGVEKFDGTEISVPIYSDKYGWLHYILNKNWTGVLVVKEPATTDTSMNAAAIYSEDGSKTIDPNANRTDTGGVFVVPTDKGIILRNGDIQGYVELATQFKVEKLENPSVEITFDKKTGKKIAIVSISNSSEKVAVTLDTGTPYKLMAAH
jgi:hypothetical protein